MTFYMRSQAPTCVLFRYSPATNNWEGGASLGFVKKQFHGPNNQLANAIARAWSHIYVFHGIKTAKERLCCVFGIPADPSTRMVHFGPLPHLLKVPLVQSLGWFSTSTTSTSGFAFGTTFCLSASSSFRRVAYRSTSPPSTVPSFNSIFGAGSSQPAVSTSGSLFRKRPTPSAACLYFLVNNSLYVAWIYHVPLTLCWSI